MLKGRDQLVAATSIEAGLKVSFNPYMFEDCADETWQLDGLPTIKEKSRLRRQMDSSGLEEALPIGASFDDIRKNDKICRLLFAYRRYIPAIASKRLSGAGAYSSGSIV
jgi:hypothetical protein